MYRLAFTILVSFISFVHGTTYLPSIYWDPKNPILEKKFWKQVTPVKQFDIVTFICPNEIIKIRTTDEPAYREKLYQHLYVKEIQENTKHFDEACDRNVNSTAIFIMNCSDPDKFNYQIIHINDVQASPKLPRFQRGKHYMFFATSDGTKESLNSNSKNCSMVFRVHFLDENKEHEKPSCSIFERKQVCEKPPVEDCTKATPQNVKTKVTNNDVEVSWELDGNKQCNVTFFTVSYRVNTTEEWDEVLVPGKRQSTTLTQLTADHKYIVKVRAHTAKGPGNYSKEIVFKTDKENEPEISAQIGKDTKLEGKSIAIGFAIGVSAALLTAAFGLLVRKIYKKRFQVKDEDETEQNNPHFNKGTEDTNGGISVNKAYRESGQNFRLPVVPEEQTHLYVSDA